MVSYRRGLRLLGSHLSEERLLYQKTHQILNSCVLSLGFTGNLSLITGRKDLGATVIGSGRATVLPTCRTYTLHCLWNSPWREASLPDHRERCPCTVHPSPVAEHSREALVSPYLFLGGICEIWTALVAQIVKTLLAMWETQLDPWVGKIPWRRAWQPSLAWRIP